MSQRIYTTVLEKKIVRYVKNYLAWNRCVLWGGSVMKMVHALSRRPPTVQAAGGAGERQRQIARVGVLPGGKGTRQHGLMQHRRLGGEH